MQREQGQLQSDADGQEGELMKKSLSEAIAMAKQTENAIIAEHEVG